MLRSLTLDIRETNITKKIRKKSTTCILQYYNILTQTGFYF